MLWSSLYLGVNFYGTPLIQRRNVEENQGVRHFFCDTIVFYLTEGCGGCSTQFFAHIIAEIVLEREKK